MTGISRSVLRAVRIAPLPVLAAIALAACGGGGDRVPTLGALPLAHGLRVTEQIRTCDRGQNAYCALQFVVVGAGYRTSEDILSAETRLLRQHGWHHANAPVGQERAADGPGNRLRVTYATVSQELQAVDLGWVKRPHPLTVTLSHLMFAHSSALAMVLELGTA